MRIVANVDLGTVHVCAADEPLPPVVADDVPLCLVPRRVYTSVSRVCNKWPMATLHPDRVAYSFATWGSVKRIGFTCSVNGVSILLSHGDKDLFEWPSAKGCVTIHFHGDVTARPLMLSILEGTGALSDFSGITVDTLEVE